MGEKRYGYLDASPENLSTRGMKINATLLRLIVLNA